MDSTRPQLLERLAIHKTKTAPTVMALILHRLSHKLHKTNRLPLVEMILDRRHLVNHKVRLMNHHNHIHHHRKTMAHQTMQFQVATVSQLNMTRAAVVVSCPAKAMVHHHIHRHHLMNIAIVIMLA